MPFVLAGLAVLIMLPSLRQGWVSDDLWHRAWLLEPSQMSEGYRNLTHRLPETGETPGDNGNLSWVLMRLF